MYAFMKVHIGTSSSCVLGNAYNYVTSFRVYTKPIHARGAGNSYRMSYEWLVEENVNNCNCKL